MPVRAIQKKWAALRAVLFPWEIGGYMALAVLIAVIADGLAWALDIAVAVLAGAKTCAERPAASGWSSGPRSSPLEYDEARHVASFACFYSLRVFRIRRTCLVTEQRKAPIESLRSQAESLGLSMHKSDSEGLYYLAKEEPVSGESRRIGPDMSPDDIAAFLMEETAVRAALRPTCWLAEVAANIERLYKSDTVSVIVEVVAKDADAPELAYEQASRFVATK